MLTCEMYQLTLSDTVVEAFAHGRVEASARLLKIELILTTYPTHSADEKGLFEYAGLCPDKPDFESCTGCITYK